MPRCYCESDPTFQPATRLIQSITQSYPATITTTTDHLYESGTIVRLDIPQNQYVPLVASSCGMRQLDGFVGPITVTAANTFTIDIDTSPFDPFSVPVLPDPHDNVCALVVPIGEVSSMLTAAVHNTLGS